MANRFFIASAPHLHSDYDASRLMADVVIALMPALAVSAWVFGLKVLLVTAVSVVSCVLLEFLIQKFVVRGPLTIFNFSAVVTSVLLAFNLPADIPLWIVVIGAVVAIGVAKMPFGGLGKNPFNPAIAARVFLLIAYPVQMTSFPAPRIDFVDAYSGATPLAALNEGKVDFAEFDAQGMFLGAMSGSLGEIASLALLVGFAYLLWRKVISWHIPVAVLGTMAVFGVCVAATRLQGDADLLWQYPLFHLLGGGALLGAIYMATDYVTSPMTRCGMIIYGVGIGALTMCIRLWGAYPEGMSFAILIMNGMTPLINKYVKPKRFGAK